jgi:hypothetical protein
MLSYTLIVFAPGCDHSSLVFILEGRPRLFWSSVLTTRDLKKNLQARSQCGSRHQCALILSLCQVRAGKLATLASRSHRPLSQCQCIEECNLGSVIANDLSSVTCLQCHLTIINGSPSEPAQRSLDVYAAAAPSSGAAKGPAGPTRVCIAVASFPTAKERNQSQWLNVFAVAWRG